MSKKISIEVRNKATALRQQGKTYKEISEALNISERWCKANLSNITKTEDEIFNSLCEKSKTPTGVSKSEVAKSYSLYELPKEEIHKVLNSKVKKIRAKDKVQNIVRPDWMLPDMAEYITQQVLDNSIILEERCNEAAFELWCALKVVKQDTSKIPSVSKIKSAIMSIAATACSTAPGSTERLKNWLYSLEKTAVELGKRNPEVKVKVLKKSDTLDTQDLEDFMY